jgi:hypothetical protein
MTCYWEVEHKIKVQDKELVYRFKEIDPLDILSIASEMELYFQEKDNDVYKKYLNDALSNTEVKVNTQWLPLKEGNNYYPAYMKSSLKALREIVNVFFSEVIIPVFTESNG